MSQRLTGWRWTEQRTPVADVSILILDHTGAANIELLSRLAHDFDTHGTALEFRPGDGFSWWWFHPQNEPSSGEGCEAMQFIEIWYDLAKLVVEGAGCIRGPRTH
ncbi:MAG: hypothetical protein ACJ746_06695 [Bryobacteraceae bacterium]